MFPDEIKARRCYPFFATITQVRRQNYPANELFLRYTCAIFQQHRANTSREAAQVKEDDMREQERKRILEEARIDTQLSLINATETAREVGGIQDADGAENFLDLDDEPFGMSDRGEGISPIKKAPNLWQSQLLLPPKSLLT